MESHCIAGACLLVSLVALGCDGSNGGLEPLDSGTYAAGGAFVGSGGATSTGGVGVIGSTGGFAATGGSVATGGFTATGGMFGTGGTITTGGAFGSGGAIASGGTFGSGGVVYTGGTVATGGTIDPGTGGTTDPGTGGDVGTGGTISTGGVAGTGGTISTGGVAGTGGTISTGGIAGTGGTISTGGVAGTGGTSGTGGVMSTGGTTSVGGVPPASALPTVNGACPAMNTSATTVAGTPVHLWVGSKPGPVYFYWHATGQTYTEVNQGMPGATTNVGTVGGLVASFDSTNAQGLNTGNNVWYTGDFNAADQILACAIQSGLADTSRIYTAGYSAGGLQACAMVVMRGQYLAAAICYSGGAAVVSGTPQETTNLPATLLLHGAAGSDAFIIDFNQASHTWENAYVAAGGFAIDCDDGGDHITSAFTRMGFGGRAMTYFADHTYHNQPEPYAAGLPADWPSYCHIVQ